ncbi:inorganic pyrophosphatase [Nemania abortiva]|nr:inorganic pyrophosphatase [Nemania abortiva]
MSSLKHTSSGNYTTCCVGRPHTPEYRVYTQQDGNIISPWHDIPLFTDAEQRVLNMVVEIPRFSNAKFEISRDERLNPIKQDIKDGAVRFVKNVFPYKGYIWNYGALPQTWEDPHFKHLDIGHYGDNDPLDACEIGTRVAYTGEVKQVKVLSIMCLVDGNDTDWKVIVVDVKDAIAPKLNDINDIELAFPGLLAATTDWFRVYKKPDGKPTNPLGLGGQFKDKHYAEGVVRECSDAWKRLVSHQLDGGSISLFQDEIITKSVTPQPLCEPSTHGWFFYDREKL